MAPAFTAVPADCRKAHAMPESQTQAVVAGRLVFEGLTESIDPDVAEAAAKLVEAIQEDAEG
jgi:hypothetical protein